MHFTVYLYIFYHFIFICFQSAVEIMQPDPAYVNFSFTDEEGQAFRELNERREKPITGQDLVVDLQYAGGTLYPHAGRIDTAAQRVDPQTGTIQARAVFPNPEGTLLPGQFVRVRVRGITLPDAIVVPSQAVSQGPQGPSVYVVGESGIAQEQPIDREPVVARPVGSPAVHGRPHRGEGERNGDGERRAPYERVDLRHARRAPAAGRPSATRAG